MKKVLYLLVALLLIGSIALAEAIDLSSMTDDELLTLKDQVSQAISDRGLVKEFQMSAGMYVGGVDIKPGSYRLIIRNDNSVVDIAICKDVNSLDDNKGLLYRDSAYAGKEDETAILSFSIAEGNVMVIKAKGLLTLEKADMIG